MDFKTALEEFNNLDDCDEYSRGGYLSDWESDHHDTIRAALQKADLAQSLADALEEAKSVIASINSGKQHKVELEDDVAYWQRGEWCEWAKNDVLPKIEAALANYRKGE